MAGEASSVNMSTVENFRSGLPALIAAYSPEDIYNADETGLLYKCLPNKTLHYKSERCHGGKMSKERLTILPICNMTGTITLQQRLTQIETILLKKYCMHM